MGGTYGDFSQFHNISEYRAFVRLDKDELKGWFELDLPWLMENHPDLSHHYIDPIFCTKESLTLDFESEIQSYKASCLPQTDAIKKTIIQQNIPLIYAIIKHCEHILSSSTRTKYNNERYGSILRYYARKLHKIRIPYPLEQTSSEMTSEGFELAQKQVEDATKNAIERFYQTDPKNPQNKIPQNIEDIPMLPNEYIDTRALGWYVLDYFESKQDDINPELFRQKNKPISSTRAVLYSLANFKKTVAKVEELIAKYQRVDFPPEIPTTPKN